MLVILEAMKMENEIMSPRDAVVAENQREQRVTASISEPLLFPSSKGYRNGEKNTDHRDRPA